MAATHELMTGTKATALQMAETMFGDGVQVVSAQYMDGAASAAGYSEALSAAAADEVSDVTQSDGAASSKTIPSTSAAYSGMAGDASFHAAAGLPILDGPALQTDFVPDGDCLTLRFVFASEEAPEHGKLNLNEIFAVWVNGEKLEGQCADEGKDDSDAANLGLPANAARAALADPTGAGTEGLANVLTLTAPVKPGEVNTIKIGITDAGASVYETNLQISGHSFQTHPLGPDETAATEFDGRPTIASDGDRDISGLSSANTDGLGKIEIGDLAIPSSDGAAKLGGSFWGTALGDPLGTLYLTDPVEDWIDSEGEGAMYRAKGRKDDLLSEANHSPDQDSPQDGAVQGFTDHDSGEDTTFARDDQGPLIGVADFDPRDLTDEGNFNLLYDPANGENGAIEVLDQNGQVTGTFPFAKFKKAPAPCFTPGTFITTDLGERLVEELRVGDRVLTRDGGFQALRWIGQRALSATDLDAAPQLNPVRIAAGALGSSLPDRDLVVSPQHRMLLARARAEILFGEQEVLVAAAHLVGRPGIAQECPSEGVTYIHLLLDQHEILLANGAWSESYQPGALSIAGLDDGPRRELLTLFPELTMATLFPAARITLR